MRGSKSRMLQSDQFFKISHCYNDCNLYVKIMGNFNQKNEITQLKIAGSLSESGLPTPAIQKQMKCL